jgi:hypothetical protein
MKKLNNHVTYYLLGSRTRSRKGVFLIPMFSPYPMSNTITLDSKNDDESSDADLITEILRRHSDGNT